MDGSKFELIRTFIGDRIVLAKRYANGKFAECNPQPREFEKQILNAAAVILQKEKNHEAIVIDAVGGGRLVYYPSGADTDATEL